MGGGRVEVYINLCTGASNPVGKATAGKGEDEDYITKPIAHSSRCRQLRFRPNRHL